MFPTVTLITSGIFVTVRLIIAVQLTLVSRRQKLPHLLWLAAFFYLTGFGDIFSAISGWTNSLVWPWFWATGLGEIMLAIFVQRTFYRDRKSPFIIFIALALGILAVDIIYAEYLPYHSPFNWIWLIFAGSQAYRRIASDPAIDDWIKARYKLVIAYSILALPAPLWTALDLLGRVIPTVQTFIYGQTVILTAQVGIMVFVIAGMTCQYLAWVMPEKYRLWLNRNYESPMQERGEETLSEEEIMRQLSA